MVINAAATVSTVSTVKTNKTFIHRASCLCNKRPIVTTSRAATFNNDNVHQQHDDNKLSSFRRRMIPSKSSSFSSGTRTKGLVLSEDEIKNLWISFQMKYNNGETTVATAATTATTTTTTATTATTAPTTTTEWEEFDLEQFHQKYPNIQIDFSQSHNANNMNKKENAKVSTHHYSIAQEAEENLHRMYAKVKKAHEGTIPSDVQIQLQQLLMKDLEMVFDIWLSIAVKNMQAIKPQKGDDSDDYISSIVKERQKIALFALDRATQLLFQFEAEYVLNLRKSVEYDDDDEGDGMLLAAPHTINYQKLIQKYKKFYNVFFKSRKVMESETLMHIQSQSLALLKKMMKHIISRRMTVLDCPPEDKEDMIKQYDSYSEKRGEINILHSSYTQLIDLHTPKFNDFTQPPSYIEYMTMVSTSSTLLQETELYFHDFFTISSPSEANQEFLLSINPTTRSFECVIQTYVNCAMQYKCLPSAQKALEIFIRMNKRHEAYTREAESSKTSSSSVQNIAIPTGNLFKAVIATFASFNQIHKNDLEKIDELYKTINESVNVDVKTKNLLKQCRLKCNNSSKVLKL
jgi:hypothetical protein